MSEDRSPTPADRVGWAHEALERIREQLGSVVIGQNDVLEHVLAALLADGHVLLEGVPGLGKTLIVRSLACCFGGSFARVQFTPDLMPSDVTGHEFFDARTQEFTFRKGPAFTHLLLADEINRAPAKTQAALLEVMQERQITREGETFDLERPFMVLATQNPLEQEGTYPLPESELDRFLLKIRMGYPGEEAEQELVRLQTEGRSGSSFDLDGLEAIVDAAEVRALQECAANLFVDPAVLGYAVAIARATRSWAGISQGAGPRASISLVRAARARALLHGNDFATPDDVKQMAAPVLRHRVALSADLEIEGVAVDRVLGRAPRRRAGTAPVIRPTQRRPSRRTLVIAAVIAGLALATELAAALLGFGGEGLGAGPGRFALAPGVAFAFAALWDWLRIRRLPEPELERTLPHNLALQTWAEVEVGLVLPPQYGPSLSMVDGIPDALDVEGLPLQLGGPGGGAMLERLALPASPRRLRGRYRIRPRTRGNVGIGPAVGRGFSPLGLWTFTVRFGAVEDVRVYPNFAAVARWEALIADDNALQLGVKRRQRRGEGLEFHQLRAYRAGDSLRQIDWKTTSRKRELIAREYEDERDQSLVFLLDCSRRMRAKDGDLSHFDHALNAMILLSHVALRSGDAVGLFCAGREPRWLPPAKGASRVHPILATVYDLEASTLGVDFRAAAEQLASRQRRRALVVVLTHLRGEDDEDLRAGLALLQRRHLPLVVNLRPAEVEEAARAEVRDVDGALRALGARDYLAERRELRERLEAQRAHVLDVLPSQLTPALISRYYAIKREASL